MNPTATDIGVYSVKIRTEALSDTTIFDESSFLVEVYPQTNLGSAVITASCPTNIWPMVLSP